MLALDLSLNSTGYAVVSWSSDLQKATVIEVGHIDNKKQGRMKHSHGQKLLHIHNELKAVINRHEITEVVREQGFSRFNKATQALFRVVGVADLIVWAELETKIAEYSVSTVKKYVAGNGKADKTEVANELVNWLTEVPKFKNDDESDAVAVAVTHFIKQEEI